MKVEFYWKSLVATASLFCLFAAELKAETVTYSAPVQTRPTYTGEQVYVPFKKPSAQVRHLRGEDYVEATGVWVSREQYDEIQRSSRERTHIFDSRGAMVSYEIDHGRMLELERQLDRNPYDNQSYGIVRRVVNKPSTRPHTGRDDEFDPEYGQFNVQGVAPKSANDNSYPIHRTVIYGVSGTPVRSDTVTTYDAYGRRVINRPATTHYSSGSRPPTQHFSNPVSPAPRRILSSGYYPVPPRQTYALPRPSANPTPAPAAPAVPSGY